MTSEDRAVKALDAARDVLKQLVTIDAALLAFGVSFVQNITKAQGPTHLVDVATVALLCSLIAGVVGLFGTVDKTHSRDGSINSSQIRLAVVGSLLGLVVAAGTIAFYVLLSPTPLPKP